MSKAGWIRLLVIAAAIALLEALCRTRVIPGTVIIPPSVMASALYDLLRSGQMNANMQQTFRNVATAFVLSVIAGFMLGVITHSLPRLRRAIDPLLASYYSVPFFVFYPLFIVFFGLNDWPLIAIGFLFAAVAMLINTLNGLDRIPRVWLKTAHVLRLSRIGRVWHVVLPGAAPYLFTGVKLALAYSFIGVLAGEFILSSSGLGYAIAFAYDAFDNKTMYALVLFVLGLVTILNTILYIWERRLLNRRLRA